MASAKQKPYGNEERTDSEWLLDRVLQVNLILL